MRELITPKNFSAIQRKLDELLARCWRLSHPLYPKMSLDFKVYPQESYFSTVGRIWFVTPFWRGEKFTTSILFHEGHHWNIYPVDIFRSLEEIFLARKMLAEEIHFEPEIKQKSLWAKEEDWSKFPYPIEEIQFVENILGDFLINLHIHATYPRVWEDLWHFLCVEGTFYTKEKKLERDTGFELYLSVFPELLPDLLPYPLKDQDSKDKVPQIASIVKACREGRFSTVFTLKELTKLFHTHLQKDIQEGQGSSGGKMECPKCHHNDWEIIEYQKGGKWVKV